MSPRTPGDQTISTHPTLKPDAHCTRHDGLNTSSQILGMSLSWPLTHLNLPMPCLQQWAAHATWDDEPGMLAWREMSARCLKRVTRPSR